MKLKSLDGWIEDFVKVRKKYYVAEFRKIQKARGLVFSWNTAAFALGPLWGVWRRMWGFFWTFLVLELFALVQIARGLWMEAGGEKQLRYEKLIANIAKRKEQQAELSETSLQIIANLQRTADQLKQQLAQEDLTLVLLAGIFLFIVVRVVEGFYANMAYQKRYLHWCIRHKDYEAGTSWRGLILGLLLLLLTWPMTVFRFSVLRPNELLGISITKFPLGKELFSPLAMYGDRAFDWIAVHFGGLFNGITKAIYFLVNTLEILLIGTPWPVVMVVLVAMAFQLAGLRIAIFTAAAITYLAFMGLWEMSMITVALIGAGTSLCLIFGIPLGVWFGRNQKAYDISRPILDFMQTMPAFVYLIPVIAFFGTGKPPGVLATIIFAMPPVVRLTALGIRNVPEATKEAATAFGCSKWQLMRYVEIPLAMPSIMTGINQTVMMGLSMVVIASLIGAEGLGALILEALQYAAKGQGLLGGVAILLCAMVIDRIAQGSYRRKQRN